MSLEVPVRVVPDESWCNFYAKVGRIRLSCCFLVHSDETWTIKSDRCNAQSITLPKIEADIHLTINPKLHHHEVFTQTDFSSTAFPFRAFSASSGASRSNRHQTASGCRAGHFRGRDHGISPCKRVAGAAVSRSIQTHYHGQYNLQGALQAAQNTEGGWRLPNIKELRSLVERSCFSPSVNERIFPNTVAGFYLSSSPTIWAGDAGLNWIISFSDGRDEYDNKNYVKYYTRLVRSE